MSLRVVLLKRTTLLHKDQYGADLGLDRPMLGPWVTMGHFDAMYSYLLETKDRNVFSVIHENNSAVAEKNDGYSYYHPLYLLTNQDDTAFWKQGTWFMTVTRIHLASAVTESDDVQRLRKYIFDQCKKAGCSCYVYQTIELSDLTLVVKSDRISSMLGVILNLWSHPGIGKIYTYCGVDYGYLKKLDVQPAEDDNIDFLSMRFAVRTPGSADGFFQIVKDELGDDSVYSVTGVDDTILNFAPLPARKLVSFLRRWLVIGLPANIDLPCGFSDITTRLGADYQKFVPNENDLVNPDSPKSSTHPPVLKSLDQLCRQLVKLSSSVLKLAEGKLDSPMDLYWLRNLSELSYSLLRLSRTALLDEFVYMMFPGVRSFLLNLEDYLVHDNQERLDWLDKESCWKFVDNWSHLMEHVMRTEGQLAHHPETRPILYDIPLAMLEHTLAFLDLCSEILQRQDAPKKQIRYILFPRLCGEIEAEEMYAADSQRPGLLSISIPLHLMYEPQTVQSALCHEISHFVGESHRNRDLRRDCYIQAVAVLMADVIFETEHKGFITQITERLKQHVSKSGRDMWTISDLEISVQEWIAALLDNETTEKYCDLIRDTLNNTKPGTGDNRLELQADIIALQNRCSVYFMGILHVFTTLFREVFADICMVHLLKLETNTYMDMFYKDIVENPGAVEFYAVRIFVTLSAAKRHLPKRTSFPENEAIGQFFRSMERLKDCCSDRDTVGAPYVFPQICVGQLQNYSNRCAEDLRALLKADDVAKVMATELRKMYYNVIDPNMDCDLLQIHINRFRRKCLSETK